MAHPRARRLIRSSSLLPLLLCTACLSVPDLRERPQLREVQATDLATPAPIASVPVAAPEGGWPDANWWENYGDAQLSQLIEGALANSPTMDEAAARVRGAMPVPQQAGASRYPEISASAQGGVAQQSVNT